MPRVTYTPSETSNFGVPVGSYVANFLKTEERPPFEGPSKFGKPSTEPRIEWFFEVTEGGFRGKLITQTTGNRPSGPKAKFTKLLKGLLGRMPSTGEQIDTDQFIGQTYRIEVEVNPDSDAGNLHIGYMAPVAGAAPVAPGTPPPPAPRPARPQTTTPVQSPTMSMYWVDVGGKTERMSGAQVVALMSAAVDPAQADTIPIMSDDQKSGWQVPSHFGLKPSIPF